MSDKPKRTVVDVHLMSDNLIKPIGTRAEVIEKITAAIDAGITWVHLECVSMMDDKTHVLSVRPTEIDFIGAEQEWTGPIRIMIPGLSQLGGEPSKPSEEVVL